MTDELTSEIAVFKCPVCDYAGLDEDPALQRFNICPRCGTEFGYDDAGPNREDRLSELRAIWIEGGARWWFIR